mmetsp:Transcript_13934/g.23703  ORF Transcript_13934/g.23703 Transcript_13934/m.23703 type:complete len:487 (+) Transcript_13934:102-1562(+)
MQSQRCQQLIRGALLLLVSSNTASASSLTSLNNRSESDIVDSNLPRLLRGNENTLDGHLNAAIKGEEDESVETTPWYHPSRMLNPLTTCPWPDDTSLVDVRSGQYGSETGDCFYMYYDASKCGNGNKCPLYIYVDGTENAADIDERDSTYMIEMAQRGYIAVTVDYDDAAIKYTDGCDSFHDKSKKIFDASVTGSVLHQLCYENSFGHRDHIPVDCQLGVVVSGWSQGSHVASLAGNYAPSLITAGLFWGNGNYNTACMLSSTCMLCAVTDVSCMNSNYVSLPKEKRRNISGDRDTFFGACTESWGANNRENVIDQLRAVSGYSCSSTRNNCFRQNFNKAGYFVIPEKGHNFMDVSPTSEFMDPETPWGLPPNLDWLAEQGRVSSPSGVCSGNSGITAGNPCLESSECECGRWLKASESDNDEAMLTLTKSDSGHRGLPKDDNKGGGGGGGGGKPNPSPTPPVTPVPTTSAPTDAPSPSDFCGCIY